MVAHDARAEPVANTPAQGLRNLAAFVACALFFSAYLAAPSALAGVGVAVWYRVGKRIESGTDPSGPGLGVIQVSR
jgi:hypothetical protein